MIVDRMRVFNMREWRRHPGRTVMSLVVVAISAMLLVAVFGIAGSITGSADRFVAGIGGTRVSKFPASPTPACPKPSDST